MGTSWTGRIFMLGLVAFVAYHLYKHREVAEPGVETKSDSKIVAGISRYGACMAAAQRADNFLQEGAKPFLRPPADASTWSAAETRILNAISEGENVCTGGITEGERHALAEVREALETMKRSVDELNRAQQARGGGDLARLQGEIYDHLNRARASMGR